MGSRRPLGRIRRSATCVLSSLLVASSQLSIDWKCPAEKPGEFRWANVDQTCRLRIMGFCVLLDIDST